VTGHVPDSQPMSAPAVGITRVDVVARELLLERVARQVRDRVRQPDGDDKGNCGDGARDSLEQLDISCLSATVGWWCVTAAGQRPVASD
jgi:hypothetical protein